MRWTTPVLIWQPRPQIGPTLAQNLLRPLRPKLRHHLLPQLRLAEFPLKVLGEPIGELGAPPTVHPLPLALQPLAFPHLNRLYVLMGFPSFVQRRA
jgi:hypothetical protein